jgi:hypothetical protein
MHWNRHSSGVPVFDHHVVATLHSIQAKPKILQGSYGLPAIYGGGIRHLANSDKSLQRLQLCGGKRNLLMVGFH